MIIDVQHETVSKTYSHGAEEGYRTYTKNITIIKACGCAIDSTYVPDKPGFRDRTEYVDLFCKHFLIGKYDINHETVTAQRHY